MLRLPLLARLQQLAAFQLASISRPLLFGLLVAFSAGLFEETARLLLGLALTRRHPVPFSQPLLVGLGHGLAEVAFLLLPAARLLAMSGQLWLALLERFWAVVLHTGLTVLVWNGLIKKKPGRHWLAALLVHGLVNAAIPVFAGHRLGLWLMEGVLLVSALALALYAALSARALYVKGDLNP